MELGFLLSVIGLLAGIWLYLYKTILELTVNAPGDPTLLFMGYMHLTVLVYLVLALYVFFRRGLAEPFNPNSSTRLASAAALVLQTWPVVLACLLLSFLFTKVSQSDFGTKSFV